MAWEQWAVQPPQCTSSFARGSGQCNSCNALPHCLGTVGRANLATHCLTALGQWAVQLLQCTAWRPGPVVSATPGYFFMCMALSRNTKSAIKDLGKAGNDSCDAENLPKCSCNFSAAHWTKSSVGNVTLRAFAAPLVAPPVVGAIGVLTRPANTDVKNAPPHPILCCVNTAPTRT